MSSPANAEKVVKAPRPPIPTMMSSSGPAACNSPNDLWAILTAEVPLTSMFAGEVLNEGELPIRLNGSHLVLPA